MLLNCTCDSWGPHFHHYSCTDPCVHCSQVGWCTSGTLHMTRQRRGWLDTDMHWCCTSRCMTLWQHATHNCIIMLATHILAESKKTSALCVSISLDVAKHPHTQKPAVCLSHVVMSHSSSSRCRVMQWGNPAYSQHTNWVDILRADALVSLSARSHTSTRLQKLNVWNAKTRKKTVWTLK